MFDEHCTNGIVVGQYRSDESAIIYSRGNLRITHIDGYVNGCIIRTRDKVFLKERNILSFQYNEFCERLI